MTTLCAPRSVATVSWPPFIDLNNPCDLGLEGTRSFRLDMTSDISLGVWSVLQCSLHLLDSHILSYLFLCVSSVFQSPCGWGPCCKVASSLVDSAFHLSHLSGIIIREIVYAVYFLVLYIRLSVRPSVVPTRYKRVNRCHSQTLQAVIRLMDTSRSYGG